MGMMLLAQVEIQEELASTVSSLSESSIKLAEATANFGALKVIFGVFLVFMIIMIVAFFWQLFSTQKKVSDIHLSTVKIEKFFEESKGKSIGKPQANVMIRREFSQLAQTIKYNILRARLELQDHESQKEYIMSKLSRIVNYEFAELTSFLANFSYEDKSLADVIDATDAQLITDFMSEQVFLDANIYTISAMDQSTDILLNGIKLEVLNHIS